MTDAPDLTPYGCYTNAAVTLAHRLKIIKTANWLVDHADDIDYCALDVLLPADWDDTLGGIDYLRCDGLVEMCYEYNSVMVWGALWAGPNSYDIRVNDYQDEHNAFDPFSWWYYLAPSTQCGYEHTRRGIDWQTQFSTQDLCTPIGSTGGN